MEQIAVIVTCFNRAQITLRCLDSFYQMNVPSNFKFDVYLVDDKSPDSTGRIIKEKYPQINVIKGTGNLYWTGGMRLAWETAVKTKDYDFFLWLNDDTILFQDAFLTMIGDQANLRKKDIEALVEGIFCDPNSKKVTYSGINKNIGFMSPVGIPQECDLITGNFVLISKIICEKVGILSKHYTHGIGDTDYGMRTLKKGFKCYVSSKFVGHCKINPKIQWFSSDLTLKERCKTLFSVTGGSILEYFRFVFVQRGVFAFILSFFHTLMRLLLPKFIKK